jgi:hypothetical protein
VCPYDVNSVKSNTLISEKIRSLSYIESSHLVSAKEGSNYYKYTLTAENEYKRETIGFLDGNILIMICLIVSAVIAVLSVVAVFFVALTLTIRIDSLFKKYLEDARKFSIAKKINQGSVAALSYRSKVEKEDELTNSILRIGLFSTERVTIEKSKESKKKRSFVIRFSFFKIVDFYYDYQVRMNTHSFRYFLNNMYVDYSTFLKGKYEDEADFTRTSIRIDHLTAIYLEFWTKYGLRPRNIQEEDKVLKEYKIEIVKVANSTTNAYLGIRWKTNFEKNSMGNPEEQGNVNFCYQ